MAEVLKSFWAFVSLLPSVWPWYNNQVPLEASPSPSICEGSLLLGFPWVWVVWEFQLMLSGHASSLLNLRPGCFLQKSHAKLFQQSSSVLPFFVSNSAYQALSVSIWSAVAS